jgi:hypothetical protein
VGRRAKEVEHLDLPAGAYLLFGKISLAQTSSHSTRVICGLRAAGRFDRATVNLGATGTASATTADLLLGVSAGSPVRAALRCRYYVEAGQRLPRVRAGYVEINAVLLESLARQ